MLASQVTSKSLVILIVAFWTSSDLLKTLSYCWGKGKHNTATRISLERNNQSPIIPPLERVCSPLPCFVWEFFFLLCFFVFVLLFIFLNKENRHINLNVLAKFLATITLQDQDQDKPVKYFTSDVTDGAAEGRDCFVQILSKRTPIFQMAEKKRLATMMT